MIAIYIILALVGGFAAGFLFQKNQSQKYIIENELLKQQAEQIKNLREDSLQATKAAALEVSQNLTQQLLATHKQENEQAKKQAQEITKQETENLHKEFKSVVEKLSAINGQSQTQEKKLSAIWQSLTSPVKASNFAEIGLENTLKNFGLEQGRDFDMQSAIDGTRLRPDAIINLPAGNLILIDAKTSKYFIEIAAAENDADSLKEKLRASMNTHLQQLTSRDYVGASRVKTDNAVTVIVMYLPNDTAYGRVLECDPEFERKCRESGVLLATPASMHMLLSIATHQISRAKQEQNYKKILDEMGKVISSLDVMLRAVADVGKAIKTTAEKFSDIGRTANSRLLPRVKRIIDLGVEPETASKLPAQIPTITITENVNYIELEEEKQPHLKKVENA